VNCFDSDCECACHDNDDDDDNDRGEVLDDIALMYDSINTYFNPASRGSVKTDYAQILANGLTKLEDVIDGARGDPGKLYPLHERVRQIFAAPQTRSR
jgi:hypothetical protein